MKSIKPILTASLIVATTAIAATSSAEARHLRRGGSYSDYVVSAGVCGAPGPRPTYIYPAANWEPFFRRHVYRYGPILICEPLLQTNVVSQTNVISVRY